jgi:hypothetical protein
MGQGRAEVPVTAQSTSRQGKVWGGGGEEEEEEEEEECREVDVFVIQLRDST